jgi:hypothetical protein
MPNDEIEKKSMISELKRKGNTGPRTKTKIIFK